ncbi:hypothetical protein EG328_006102 [Venturia inaequalis]|uniref:Uncharacterized protein n=1 Tax=Venturia inaequalis TaxID=5025 RepID=A0A8H3YSW5_VENIN|nr:hypothetical protein EG328_006102 [Venturia inaequalis]RDI86576.1 hypothetical protein Vi05172_g3469 [Venturia inaequalis]
MDSKTNMYPDTKVVNYERIIFRDKAELVKLAKACLPPPNGLGYFFLDLRRPSTSYVIQDLAEINASTWDYFSQPYEARVQDGISEHSGEQRYSMSTIEALEFPTKELDKDCISLSLPGSLQPALEPIRRFLTVLEYVAIDIFTCLCLPADPTGNLHGVSTVRGRNLNHESALRLCFEEPTSWKKYAKHRDQAGDDIGGAEHTMGILRIMQYDAARLCWRMDCVAGEETWSDPLPPAEGCLLVNLGDGMQALTGGRYHAPVYKYIKVNNDEEGLCSFEYTLRQENWMAPHATEEASAGIIPSQIEELEIELAQVKKQKKQVEQEKGRIERDLKAGHLAFKTLKAKYRLQRRSLRSRGGCASNSTDGSEVL